MMDKLINLILFFLVLSFPRFSIGQKTVPIAELPAKYLKLYKEAQSESRNGQYSKALSKLNKIIKANPDCDEIYIKKAGVLYNLLDTTTALETLTFAINKFEAPNAELYFTRGYMYFERREYSKAKVDFAYYVAKASVSEERLKRANDLKTLSAFRDSLLSNPVAYNPVLLPKEINSSYSEYSPSLSIDGRYIVFTRRVNQQEDLYVSYVDSLGNYSLAFPLLEINTASNEGAHCVSADGKLILFTGCDRDILHRGCDLYFSVLHNDEWSKPANIGKVINTPAWESQPCLSADGKTLFFVSDRVGGFGGRDIWFSKKNERNVWSIPENLGPEINSPKDDETPFLHPDGKTLYWRSNGRLGMGDFDIYTARWDDHEQKWSEVKNLGFPVNTEKSEGGLVVSLDGTKAYFATEMASNQPTHLKNLEICSFTLPPFAKATPTTFLNLFVYDNKTNTPLSAQVEIQNLLTKSVFYSGKTGSNGKLLIPIHGDMKYAIHISKDQYSFASEQIDVVGTPALFDPFSVSVGLMPLEVKDTQKIVLHNLFFESGKFEILPESYAEIENLYSFLLQNPEVKIRILGHTDNIGSSEDNLILSQKRAHSVKEAIVSKGISSERVEAIGKGQNEPIATNDTVEGRKLNRRTECQILNR